MVCVKRNVIKDIGVLLLSVWSDEMLVQRQEAVGRRCGYGIEPL
jgi:hypothetical protein